MRMEDEDHYRATDFKAEVEAVFNQQYLGLFTKHPPPFVRLESENFADHLTCTILILYSRNA